MQSLNSLKTQIFKITDQNFEQAALELFFYQYNNNNIYRKYVNNLKIHTENVDSMYKIPFLPIRFFKTNKIQTGEFLAETAFVSSGTTGAESKHYIEDLDYYKTVCSHIFNSFFGEISGQTIIGLLPSYLERTNSSLVVMVNDFIQKSENENSGFYLSNLDELVSRLISIPHASKKIILFGVTFALIELAKKHTINLEELIIIETGGMKGRGKELVREELHQLLKSSFNTEFIYSEYGMTELLSQAYMKKDRLFHTPAWMKVMIREIHDPFQYAEKGRTGIIKVIDLANVHSCAFIETEDIGIKYEKGFQVLGRLDNSDLRGCNLLLS